MAKNTKKDNSIIKRKNLILKLKEKGIRRVSPDAILFLERALKEYLQRILESLGDEVISKGRKTLKSEDIQSVVGKFEKKKEDWEI